MNRRKFLRFLPLIPAAAIAAPQMEADAASAELKRLELLKAEREAFPEHIVSTEHVELRGPNGGSIHLWPDGDQVGREPDPNRASVQGYGRTMIELKQPPAVVDAQQLT